MADTQQAARIRCASTDLACRTSFGRRCILPVVFTIFALAAIIGVMYIAECALEAKLEDELQDRVRAVTRVVHLWFHGQQRHVQTIAEQPRKDDHIGNLIRLATTDGVTPSILKDHADQQQLKAKLDVLHDTLALKGYHVATPDGIIVAAHDQRLLGQVSPLAADGFIRRTLAKGATVIPTFRSPVPIPGENDAMIQGAPCMYAVSPVARDGEQPIGVLAFRIDPDLEFTRITGAARKGETGHTYALDDMGIMISHCRFQDSSAAKGLATDDDGVVLNFSLRDPGVDLTKGETNNTPRLSLPLTKMAGLATSGQSGVDARGYRDYRGVEVVGAWSWLPDYNIGIATEMDKSEAYLPLKRLRMAIWVLIAVIIAYYVVALVFTFRTRKLRQRAQAAERSMEVLGQYHLKAKIGEGGMGSVYQAEHAMLKRPTALKMIRPDVANPELIQRFEREVQLTAKLAHPNTIAIYDYGRTNDNVFYYAMELLDGVSLKELVANDGPQSPGRVIHIVRQICGSLHEAHSQCLVHRDIKPANIMLCRRAGFTDVVKVLDFGLVKSLRKDEDSDLGLTGTHAITGTPLYMSPEVIENPSTIDGRSDLYAVGAVAYFLLTGNHVFVARGIHDLMRMHVTEKPKPPSERSGREVPSDLENIIMQCLEKKPSDRPCSAKALDEILSLCQDADAWSRDDADSWWEGESEPTVIIRDGEPLADVTIAIDATQMMK